jgi:hypothetical protein
MAGGTFTTYSKRRPGAYINVDAPQKNVASAETTRGVVFFVGGSGLGWGANGIIKLSAASNFRKLIGVDPYADLAAVSVKAGSDSATVTVDAKLQAVLTGLRETLKSAQTVLYYNINSGDKAVYTDDKLPWSFAAKYAGTRGNDIKVGIVKSPLADGKLTVTTYFGSTQVDKQSVSKASELVSNDYVDVTVTTAAAADDGLALIAAIDASTTPSLAGGSTDAAAEVDTDELIKAMEVQEFNTVVAAGQDDTAQVHQLLATTAVRLRDEEGQKVVAVIPDGTDADTNSEGVIVVANAVTLADGTQLTLSQTAGWVAGAEAAAGTNESLTYTEYPDAIDVGTRFTNEDTISALEAGKLLFTVRRDGSVVIEDDINSLHTFNANQSQSLSKNRVIRVIDDIANNTKGTFESNFVGKINNDATGRDLFKANRISYLNSLVNNGSIQAFAADDITVAAGDDLDQIVVNLAIQPIDAMEKLYMTVRI